jgi:hypothetical protein
LPVRRRLRLAGDRRRPAGRLPVGPLAPRVRERDRLLPARLCVRVSAVRQRRSGFRLRAQGAPARLAVALAEAVTRTVIGDVRRAAYSG